MKAYRDPGVEFCMRKVGLSVLRENLKLTYEQRLLKHQRAMHVVRELERSGKKVTTKQIEKVTRAVYSVASKGLKSRVKIKAR